MLSCNDTPFIRNSTKRKCCDDYKLAREEGPLKRLSDDTSGTVTIVYKTSDLHVDTTDISDDVCMTLAELRISLRSTNRRTSMMYRPPTLRCLSMSNIDTQQQVGDEV